MRSRLGRSSIIGKEFYFEKNIGNEWLVGEMGANVDNERSAEDELVLKVIA